MRYHEETGICEWRYGDNGSKGFEVFINAFGQA